MSALVLLSLLLNRILYFQLDPFVLYHTVLTLSSVLNPDCYILKMLHNKIGHCNRVTDVDDVGKVIHVVVLKLMGYIGGHVGSQIFLWFLLLQV